MLEVFWLCFPITGQILTILGFEDCAVNPLENSYIQ